MATPAHRVFPHALPRRLVRRRVGRVAAGLLTLACVAGLAAGCGGQPAADPSHTVPSPAHRVSPHAAQGAQAAGPAAPAGTPSPSCPAAVLSNMTEAQRVGQLFLVGLPGNQAGGSVAGLITSHHYGSAIFGANSTGGVASARRVADAVQALASGPATAGVRFFVAANQEGGQV